MPSNSAIFGGAVSDLFAVSRWRQRIATSPYAAPSEGEADVAGAAQAAAIWPVHAAKRHPGIVVTGDRDACREGVTDGAAALLWGAIGSAPINSP
jgi:hypothetical protein